MASKVFSVVNDLVEYLLFELKSRNMWIDEFRMQKLIFKIKMELGEKHELYPKLPYYWYLKGPYSEVVTESFNSFMPKSRIQNGFLLYDGVGKNDSLVSQFSEIEDLSFNIMADKDFLYNHLDKEIYRQYAPYKFMYSYKYSIYDIAKSVDVVNFNVDDYLDIMAHCEGNFPINKYFKDLSFNYSHLTSNLEMINELGYFNEYWDELRYPIISIWETFAKGIRVKFKDNFYENNVKLWDEEYDVSLRNLAVLINKTDLLIDTNECVKQIYTPDEIRLLRLNSDYK